MPYCNSCGARNSDRFRFCVECGTPLFFVTPPRRAFFEALHPAMAHGMPHVYGTSAPPARSTGLAVLLTILFGPFGLLYTSVSGALYMLLAWCFLVLATCSDWISN